MATNIDVCNRALVLLGAQIQITALAQDSVAAKAFNDVYAPVVNWCLSLFNWNFARFTAVLTRSKTASPVNPWVSTQPTPPWKYEYALPADFVRMQYLTNSDLVTANYYGQPKRSAIVFSTTNLPALVTNETSAVIVYTSNTPAIDTWPPYFERLVVTALAFNVAAVLKPQLVEFLYKQLTLLMQIAEETNRKEGLIVEDTTPEWIQAVGIPYPQRRDQTPRVPTQGQSRDNQR